jgi:hypothetical protein
VVIIKRGPNDYRRQDEKKQKQKSKIILSKIEQISQKKTTFQKAGPRPAQIPQNRRPSGKSRHFK